MPYLKCTAKLAKVGGLKLQPPISDSEGDWHADVFRFRHRNHVLFCHDLSRFACLSGPIRKIDVSNLPNVLNQALDKVLAEEAFSDTARGEASRRLDGLQLSKTNNRSVLGSLNDYSFRIHWSADYDGVDDPNLVCSLVAQVNHMPLIAPLGGGYAIQAYRRYLVHQL